MKDEEFIKRNQAGIVGFRDEINEKVDEVNCISSLNEHSREREREREKKAPIAERHWRNQRKFDSVHE